MTRFVPALRTRTGRVTRSALQGCRRLRRRLVGTPVAAGNPRVEASIAFDRALARRRWRRRVLGGRCGRLPVLDEAAPGWRPDRGLPHEQVVAVDRVVGTVNSGTPEFDRAFRPVHEHARPRFSAVFAALYRGEAVGPVGGPRPATRARVSSSAGTRPLRALRSTRESDLHDERRVGVSAHVTKVEK